MKFILYFLTSILFIFISAFIFSLFTMLLWNWLVPEIFGLKTITWIQALGLNFLFGMLFSRVNINNKE